MTSEYPQDCGRVYCYYNYCCNVRLQICMVRCVLGVISCVMSNACHTELDNTQDGSFGLKADDLYRSQYEEISFAFHKVWKKQNNGAAQFWV